MREVRTETPAATSAGTNAGPRSPRACVVKLAAMRGELRKLGHVLAGIGPRVLKLEKKERGAHRAACATKLDLDCRRWAADLDACGQATDAVLAELADPLEPAEREALDGAARDLATAEQLLTGAGALLELAGRDGGGVDRVHVPTMRSGITSATELLQQARRRLEAAGIGRG